MSSKRDIERELYRAEAKVESLQEMLESAQTDRVELQSQVTKLQDALVAAKAPEAYRDQQIEKAEANRTPISDEQRERSRIIQKTTDAYVQGIEKPMFRDAQDMDDLLSRSLMRNIEAPGSLHNNEES